MIRTVDPVALTAYTDTGCRLAPSCLRCPIPDGCVYDYGVTPTELLALARDLAIRRRLDAGDPAQRVAAAFGVSQRSAYRAAGTARPPRRRRRPLGARVVPVC